MKIIAIPIFGTRVSSRFDCADNLLVVTSEKGKVNRVERVSFVQANPLERINMLAQLGTDVVICGGLTETCANKLSDCHIQVIPWVRGEAEEVVQQFLHGKLTNHKADKGPSQLQI
ncbi:MAG: NifB/NifX family molybdenum-iron cluster-binding protein [bacterium]